VLGAEVKKRTDPRQLPTWSRRTNLAEPSCANVDQGARFRLVRRDVLELQTPQFYFAPC
jgi:hypothetical protein